MNHYIKLACFAGGALFGSAGIKLLTSKDAKKAYTHAAAAGLRVKDSVMETVTSVQENAADILAAARDINAARAAKEAEEADNAKVEGQEALPSAGGAALRLLSAQNGLRAGDTNSIRDLFPATCASGKPFYGRWGGFPRSKQAVLDGLKGATT